MVSFVIRQLIVWLPSSGTNFQDRKLCWKKVFAKKRALCLQNVKWPDLWTKTNVNFLFDYAIWTQMMNTSWAKFAVIALSTLNKSWRSRQNRHASTRIPRKCGWKFCLEPKITCQSDEMDCSSSIASVMNCLWCKNMGMCNCVHDHHTGYDSSTSECYRYLQMDLLKTCWVFWSEVAAR